MASKKNERWIERRSLSGGGQGDVFLVKDSTGEYRGDWIQKLLRNINRIERFKREIRAGLELSHPNVIKVIDYDLESRRPYLVAEYCSGGPLSEFDFARVPIIDRLRMFAAICRGAGHAHSNNPTVIHRDIKPENIFLREDGTPVVGDFGICFVTEEGERLTLVDEAVGPRNFIAPELEDGRTDDIGPWSDVYSLGKLLYWIIAGEIFSREKHREPRFDLTQKRKDAGVFFIYELLDKMIVFEPAARFANAGAVADNVETVIRRILMNAHPVDLRAPQECSYCGLGNYVMIYGAEKYREHTPRQSMYDFGKLVSGTNAFIFACNYCGNLQLFRPEFANDPYIWIKQ
jgi:serine/threonine protein kinase